MKTVSNTRPPIAIYILSTLQFLLGLGGIYGGLHFLTDPTGASLGTDQSYLANSPFADYFVPGLMLFFVMGLVPIMLSVSLFLRQDWLPFEFLNLFPNHRWEWAWSLYLAIALIIWMDVQVLMIGYRMPIQSIYAFYGVALLVLTLWPGVERWCRR